MNRREILISVCSGATILTSGCQSLFPEQIGPIDFELLNFTEESHQASVTIRDDDGEFVLEQEYEIEGRQSNQSVVAIEEEGFTEATNGDEFNISVEHYGGETLDYQFQVSCIENDEIRDVAFAEIRSEGDDTILNFRQSSCTS